MEPTYDEIEALADELRDSWNYTGDFKVTARHVLTRPAPPGTIRLGTGLTEAQEIAARDVITERQRQVSVEGWTTEHDDDHYINGSLGIAAACYARHACVGEDDRQVNSGFSPPDWPWSGFWKPSSRRRDLVKAAALILAEIERLDRAAAEPPVDPRIAVVQGALDKMFQNPVSVGKDRARAILAALDAVGGAGGQ